MVVEFFWSMVRREEFEVPDILISENRGNGGEYGIDIERLW